MVRSFLLIGQSNMAGRGIIGAVPPIEHDGRIVMLRNGRWMPMSEPINPDREIFVERDSQIRSGVSLAASFAKAYIDEFDETAGLIPCAAGGTKVCQWQPGEVLFDHAVMQTRLALRSSELAGILWHQGESDGVEPSDCAAYEERFFTMIDAMIGQLGARVPIILGELCETVNKFPHADLINVSLRRIAASRPEFDIASADGLDLSPDGIHFSAASYREFGRRYYAAYRRAAERMGI